MDSNKVKEKKHKNDNADKVRHPIGVKLIAIISTIVLVALGGVTYAVSYFVTSDVRNNAEENNLTINSRTAADRFAELCACLSSLTPEARDKFDALGVIFWTLSEQLRNGTAPELIAAAIEYARADLFDLVSTTQNPQQAAAVRAAFDPDGYPDYFKKAA